jgi:large subunit ribosomal protein L24e
MKCVFCGKPQQPGIGTILAYNDGRVVYFCSSKCRRNYKLRRDPKRIKWARQKGIQEKEIAHAKKREIKKDKAS